MRGFSAALGPILRSARPDHDRVKLDRRHIYILPSKAGLVFGLMLLGMLLGSINYDLNLGYALTFWLAGLGLVGMLATWRNLAHLSIAASRIPPVFAGETAVFALRAAEHQGRARFAIGARFKDQRTSYTEVAAHRENTLVLELPARRRGWLKPGRVTIFTRFPLGLFHAWGYAELDLCCLVYPRPAAAPMLPQVWPQPHPSGAQVSSGDEAVSGLRDYRNGDPLRRVDWKASSRGRGLFSKTFDGQGQDTPWLDWDHLTGADSERKLSQLTRGVIDAHAAGMAFGLRLPGFTLPPASGEAHYRAALKALALFDLPVLDLTDA